MTDKIKHYIVYKITNLLTQEYYYGVHGQYEDDDYLESGIKITRQVEKYGRENFKRETIKIFNTIQEAYDYEEFILKEHLGLADCLNIAKGGRYGRTFEGLKHSDETKEILRKAATGRILSDEAKLKISEANKNRSEELKKQISETLKKRWNDESKRDHNDATKEKISESLKEYYKNNEHHGHSEETKRKISEAAKNRTPEDKAKFGRNWTDEEREKWSKTQKNKWTPEMRKKSSESNRFNVSWNKKYSCGHIERDKCSCQPRQQHLAHMLALREEYFNTPDNTL